MKTIAVVLVIGLLVFRFWQRGLELLGRLLFPLRRGAQKLDLWLLTLLRRDKTPENMVWARVVIGASMGGIIFLMVPVPSHHILSLGSFLDNLFFCVMFALCGTVWYLLLMGPPERQQETT